MNRTPSNKSFSGDCWEDSDSVFGILSESTMAVITKKPKAEIRKEVAVLVKEIIMPAIAGAIILVPVHIAEFRATAFIITDLSIKLGYKACLAGWSKALIAPASKASAITCQA